MVELVKNAITDLYDRDFVSKVRTFRNGIRGISFNLYQKDEIYYLLLKPKDYLVLDFDVCIKIENRNMLLSFLDDFACNIGLCFLDGKSKLGYNCKNDFARCGSTVYDLINVEDLYVKNGLCIKPLLYNQELTNKIKEMMPFIFNSNRNSYISSYIYNAMYKKTLSPFSLTGLEYSILYYYKCWGYEFINSFFREEISSSLDNDSVDEFFIDDLYCLYHIFDKFEVLDDKLVVFRGGSNDETCDFNSFVSTSLDINIASSFSDNLLYEIILPKGTHFIPIDAIDELSTIFSKTEAEILLRPCNFEVVDSGVRDENKFLKVIYHEKDNFGETIIDSLIQKRDCLIEKKFCNEERYEEALFHAKSLVNKNKVLRK